MIFFIKNKNNDKYNLYIMIIIYNYIHTMYRKYNML